VTNELSLFSGYGGFTLGLKLAIPNIRTIGYVEWEKYPQKTIASRIKDGFLDEAPIFGDIRAFIGEGYAEQYQGLVDILTAGFPCQPFSVAGKQKGADDSRNMWPATIETICLVRPRYILLENVPALLTNEYIRQVYGDLAAAEYNIVGDCISAAECGANHKRKRLWIMGYSQHNGLSSAQVKGSPKQTISDNPKRKNEASQPERTGASTMLAYSNSQHMEQHGSDNPITQIGRSGCIGKGDSRNNGGGKLNTTKNEKVVYPHTTR
jgi:DNA-cytosine methyltransferase